ncbi:MAG: lytic transglycosylase domain-containing protein [Caulobacteraceae bacterium]|nr:lytic transglycosylase domain-containing protein [Caulobacteraceae bacterium]
MVRRTLITLAALLSASTASAQTADWRAAGGDLFAAIDTVEPVAESSAEEPLDTPRLAPLSQPFMAAIATAAERHGLDPKLLHALVVVESAYRNEACSPVGACGLAQLMPGTAAELGVRDRFDPAENLSGGAAYLARQMLRFGDLRLALAAYNAGPGRVARLGRIPDIRETQEYVVSVVDCYLALTAGRGVRSSRECRTGAAR